jgi:ABC-type transport system substrate-binding protein
LNGKNAIIKLKYGNIYNCYAFNEGRKGEKMNRRDILKPTIVVLLALILSITALSTLGNTFAQTTSTPQPLFIGLQEDMPNFNIFDLSSNTVWKTDVIGGNFETLAGVDFNGAAIPWLASNWSQPAQFHYNIVNATTVNGVNTGQIQFTSNGSNVGYNVTVNIRQGVTFTNGMPMNATDVVFSYFAERYGTTLAGTALTEPFDVFGNGYVTFQEMQMSIHYVNEYTVNFTMWNPYGEFYLTTLGDAYIIPMQLWESHLTLNGIPDVTNGTVYINPVTGVTNAVLNTQWNSPEASIGTGPWEYTSGLNFSYRIETPYQNYWGKNFVTPAGYHVFPQNISYMEFKIYTDQDTAMLALESGQVDYVAWPVLPSYVPILAKDPQLTMHYNSQNGYFYLAFNQAQTPMNNLTFRQAVSYMIDKNTIVKDYLSGFGSAGDSPEPPFWTAWYNNSVVRYPYDLATAENLLNESLPAGPNGLRTLPNGQPIQPITILTPPASYDPVRIKIGLMLASEMSAFGIPTVATAVTFDKLVAASQSFQYQMLTLGWSLSLDPIGNVADILGPMGYQNTYAWWPANQTNPNFPNIKTLADQRSSQLAWEFEKAEANAYQTFNVNKMIYYTKEMQGIATQAIPVNVLYYQLNIEATNNYWRGWSNYTFDGTVWNEYSMAAIHTVSVVPPTVQQVNSKISLPNSVGVGQTVNGSVIVTSSNGNPIRNALVTLTTSNNNVSLSTTTGSTNSLGIFNFRVTGTGSDFVTVTANVSYGGSQSTSSALIQSLGSYLFLQTSVNNLVVQAGSSLNIPITVVNQNGDPVAGATVTDLSTIIGYGTITPTSGVTNANGQVTFTYNAPNPNELSTIYLNEHLLPTLYFTASYPSGGYISSNILQLALSVPNTNPSDWISVNLINASSYSVGNGGTVNLVLKVMNLNDQAMPGQKVIVSFSNDSYLSNPMSTVVSNSNGLIYYNATFNSNMPPQAVMISFQQASTIGLKSSVTIAYYGNETNVPDLYGGYLYFTSGNSTAGAMNSSGALNMVVHLFNRNNTPVSGKIPIGIVTSTTPDGQLVNFADPMWGPTNGYFNSADEYTGFVISTNYVNSSPINIAGEYAGYTSNQSDPNLAPWEGLSAPITTWQYISEYYGINMTPSYVVNGTGIFDLSGSYSSYRDLPITVYAIVNSSMYYYVSNNFAVWYLSINGSGLYENQFAVERAQNILVTGYSITNPSLTSYNTSTGTDMLQGTVSVYNQNGAPVNGSSVAVFAKLGKATVFSLSTTTSASGQAAFTYVLPNVTTPTTYTLYYQPQSAWNTYSILETSTVIQNPLFLSASLSGPTYAIAGQNKLSLAINNLYPGDVARVTLSSSTGGVQFSNGNTLNITSTVPVSIPVIISNITPGNSIVVISAQIQSEGYYSATVNTMINVFAPYNSVTNTGGFPTTLTVTNLQNNSVVQNQTVTIQGTVTNLGGVSSVVVSANGGTPVNATLSGSGINYNWTATVTGLKSGNNSIVVTVENSLGQKYSYSMTLLYKAPVSKVATSSLLSLEIAIVVIVIILIIIAAVVASRNRKKGKEEEKK